MIGCSEVMESGMLLAKRSGSDSPLTYDRRIDFERLGNNADDAAPLRHARHQLLLRAYQARYVLLPPIAPTESIVEILHRHYHPDDLLALTQLRHALEIELIAPLVSTARAAAAHLDSSGYCAQLLQNASISEPPVFLNFLQGCPAREHHYRNFLIQSSADLLAEASASALGIVGEFGAPQSALFRILIDEFGYGAHGRKHSVLYQATMRGFDLCDEYNAYWPLFDTMTLQMHNTIHFLFQSPHNFFLQVGFLLYAETAYQRSTDAHFRYLSRFHPSVDARYFAEHAHIDLHHSRIVADEVVAPLIATYGDAALREIVVGAELTRQVFEDTDAHLLEVSLAFDEAAAAGQGTYCNWRTRDASPTGDLHCCVTPGTQARGDASAMIQVGGIGYVSAEAFFDFPVGSIGRPISGAIS